ncbi:hypothetical protein [Burkholderia anthina]|uniref:hypothetical protein n=1 Tax=Burkholderia anthina TaxID=179879 RepID=UPI00158CD895|nr:hypothetical protein [Burkholderia anthina]
MNMRSMGLFAGALLVSQQVVADQVTWEKLGRRDDYEISWASTAQVRKGDQIGTMIRMKFDQPDQAPNNARFDNKRITVNIDCSTNRHDVLFVVYSMGNRAVYTQYVGGGLKPNDGTFVEKVATKVCPSSS